VGRRRLAQEVAPVYFPDGTAMERDNGVRADTSLDAARQARAGVRPQVRQRHGGQRVAAHRRRERVLLMREDKARALGYEPLAYVRSYAYAALDPGEQLLQGPALAMPSRSPARASPAATSTCSRSTRRSPAQVLCNLKAFASRRGPSAPASPSRWGARPRPHQRDGRLDRPRPPVRGDRRARARHLCNELRRRDGEFGVLSVCAAGGMGHVMVVERA
jgi:acetyl-CoA acyltransferase